MCSDPSPGFEKCKRIDNLSHLVPGWGCCQCRIYNGYQRTTCRRCGHPACFDFKPEELVPVRTAEGTLVPMSFAELRSGAA